MEASIKLYVDDKVIELTLEKWQEVYNKLHTLLGEKTIQYVPVQQPER